MHACMYARICHIKLVSPHACKALKECVAFHACVWVCMCVSVCVCVKRDRRTKRERDREGGEGGGKSPEVKYLSYRAQPCRMPCAQVKSFFECECVVELLICILDNHSIPRCRGLFGSRVRTSPNRNAAAVACRPRLERVHCQRHIARHVCGCARRESFWRSESYTKQGRKLLTSFVGQYAARYECQVRVGVLRDGHKHGVACTPPGAPDDLIQQRRQVGRLLLLLRPPENVCEMFVNALLL